MSEAGLSWPCPEAIHQKVYITMLASGFRDKIRWNRIFLFFSDERFVPADDPQSNFRMAKETLFDPLAIPEHQVSQTFNVNAIQ